MKKHRLFLSALCAALLLTGCQSTGGNGKDGNNEPTATPTATEPVNTPEPKVYDSSAAAEKYKAHPFLELWSSRDDVPYINGMSSIPKLMPYVAENNVNGGCVIICPGGGYVQLAIDKEGKDPAKALNENNITAFVLQYRTLYDHNALLTDVFRAIRYVRANAEEFAIDPDKIAVMGFSAGGHLASMAMEHYDEDQQNLDEIDKVSARPNYGILCYGVLSLKDGKTHELTRQTFLGLKEGETAGDLAEKYSAEEGITKDTPPAFIWHCKPDTSVPVENSTDFAAAMDKMGIENELHVYKTGAHGLGLAKDNEEVRQWFPDCVKWLQSHGY